MKSIIVKQYYEKNIVLHESKSHCLTHHYHYFADFHCVVAYVALSHLKSYITCIVRLR